MCIACIEYMKDHLTTDELKSALRETTIEDAAHREAVEKALRELSGSPEELKKELERLAKD